jgi:IQ calmodulin-binding motif
MKSLAVLLRRGVRGQLERSVVRYALFHVNSSIQKTGTTSLFRLAEKQKEGVLAISRWHRAVAHVSVSAATVIQSFVRGCIARKEVRDIFGVVFQTARLPHELTRQRDVAACTIQRTYRKWCQNRLYYVVLLQKRVRGWNARSITIKLRHNREILMAASATVIQTYQRRSAAQSRYRRRRAAVKIQSLWRHHEAQKFLNRSLRAIIVLQRFLPALAQKRKARQELIKVVILVQAVWRLSIQRRRLWRRSQLAKQMTAEVTAEIMSNSSSRCVLRVDNLLTGLESAPGPCLGRLVSRVNVAVAESTLSSASLISGLTTRGRSSTVPLPPETAASSSSEAAIGEWKNRSSTSPSSMKAEHGTSSAKSTSLAGSSPK